ncbi:hypothetical protein DER46DRAFT_628633 [Fusarium sp. MPI-SDFR-AT-0072]|nr:hypothetical protein DER46DRAFT_628633 [Fusarium sp. MPI-SDFR-AT-0072]
MKIIGPSKQYQPSNLIYLFIIILEYQLLVCKLCRFATLPNEVNIHLRIKYNNNTLEYWHRLVEQVKIRLYYTEEHLWENPRGRGRPILGLEPPANLNCKAHAYLSDILEQEENYFNRINQLYIIMTRLPDRYSLISDYVMAQGCRQGDLYIRSSYVDEQKISCTMKALDLVIDRCENTVRYTGRTLLYWLSSPKLYIYRETPFCLIAEKSSETQYKNIFDVFRGLWPDLRNYLCVKEISMALNKGPSSSAENEDEERTGNNDEDDLDPEGKDDDDSDGDWDSEDDELDHDDSAHGSDQAEFSEDTYPELRNPAGGELDIAAFDNFLELLYEVCLTLYTETFIARQPGSTLLVYFSGILGFSKDCQHFLLARQYYP